MKQPPKSNSLVYRGPPMIGPSERRVNLYLGLLMTVYMGILSKPFPTFFRQII